MMKAFVFKGYGPAAHPDFATLPRPPVGPGEILVQVHAVGLNPIDNMIPKGTFKPLLKFELPAVFGSDLAGVVVETGDRVTRFKPGDEVYASLFDLGMGALAEYALVPEHAAALKPGNLDFVQAASIPMVGLTAWQAFMEHEQIKAGQKVFIPAGSGGIGSFAIQLARHLGAKMGTTTSTANVAWVRGLGADEVIDYRQQAFDAVLQDYDAVLGTLRGDVIERSLSILKPGGWVPSLVGPLDAEFARARGMNGLMRGLFGLMSWKINRLAKQRGVTYRMRFVHPDGAQLAAIAELLETGRIQPVIDRVFPFEQAPEALAYLATGRAKGKVVVSLM
ncbi:NADP-dependent oxidoreductase [Aeromonas intestinalis]